jgi:hypothetical protein
MKSWQKFAFPMGRVVDFSEESVDRIFVSSQVLLLENKGPGNIALVTTCHTNTIAFLLSKLISFCKWKGNLLFYHSVPVI